jgi:hypothetical protein
MATCWKKNVLPGEKRQHNLETQDMKRNAKFLPLNAMVRRVSAPFQVVKPHVVAITDVAWQCGSSEQLKASFSNHEQTFGSAELETGEYGKEGVARSQIETA